MGKRVNKLTQATSLNSGDYFLIDNPNFPESKKILPKDIKLEDFNTDNFYNNKQIEQKLNNKVDKIEGKGLSTEDYTATEKQKLSKLQLPDQTYNPESENGQSGKAVAEAIKNVATIADQTYNPESANAQSGIAVAQAVDTCSPAIITTSDTGKAIAINDGSESVIKGLTAYGESVQDGTPAPDSPVEIVSVENPVINVGGQTVIIPYTFRGLKNSSGGWVARDELRVGNGKVEIVRNVDYLDCTSDLNWRKSGSTVCDIYYFVYFDTAVEGLQPTLCTHFKGIPSVSLGNSYLLDKGVWFAYAPHNTTTVEDWKSFLDTANMSVIFASETSTVEDITATEAGQALLALKSNYPSTSVISDIDLNITYKADTKNYIDNKIAALTALTLEG